MGTPDFSVQTMEALLGAGHEIILAVTQPDRPKGRGKQMAVSPVKEYALSHGIKVFQPEKIREPKAISFLKQFPCDVMVVVAFGQILPREVLQLPPYGCINVHASLLPKYRGAAPIQYSLMAGDTLTGVTTMQMDVGMDTGDILLQETYEIRPEETGGSLFEVLSAMGAGLCVKTLDAMEKGTLIPIPQDDEKATYTRMIRKTDGRIDFSKSAEEIACLIRAMTPWPSAYCSFSGKTMKIWSAQAVSENAFRKPSADNLLFGSVAAVEKEAFYVKTGKGYLKITELQMEGKKRMKTGAFLRGYALAAGQLLR